MAEDNQAEQEEPVVVRDRRKVDADGGQAQPAEQASEEEPVVIDAEPADAGSAETGAASADAGVAKQLEERTADLQRLQAEYANYRRRVERDREAAAVNAKAGLVGELLTVVDDIERAEQHGDLTGAFKTVADKFNQTLQQAGLESFGTENEPFDPNVHEAVQHGTSSEVDGPTVTTVLRRGYRIGEKVVRNAMVAVTDYEAPASGSEAGTDSADPTATEQTDQTEQQQQ